jgi:hypothetical protein
MKNGRDTRDKRVWEDYGDEWKTWEQVETLLTHLVVFHCDSKPLVSEGDFVNTEAMVHIQVHIQK